MSDATREGPDDSPLTHGWGVLATTALAMALLLVGALSGGLAPLERALRAQMAVRPLPLAYFLTFILLGALLPLLLRWLHRRQAEARRVINPYLLLLAGQIVSEAVLVQAGGKGLGVVVGMVFTLVRLVQLLQLRPLAGGRRWLRRLLTLELALWSLNALQMLLFRWLPLLG